MFETTTTTDDSWRLHTLGRHYSKLYQKDKHDSPEAARISMAKRIREALKAGIPLGRVLNIGSGPQSLERQLQSCFSSKDLHIFEKTKFVTLDFAIIEGIKLLARKFKNVLHIRADASQELPFIPESFGLVVSHLAIDFLPRDALQHVSEILAPNGSAFFYFHHPSMIPEDLRPVRSASVKNFWTYLRDNKVLFETEEEIRKTLEQAGFRDIEINLKTDRHDRWWEISCKKINSKSCITPASQS